MKAKKKHLKKLCQRRELVSIDRKAIGMVTLHGFIVGFSDKLVCLLSLYDLSPDGLCIVRRKDIANLRKSAGNKFQKQMLKDDGVLETLDFSHCPPLTSWRELFDSIADEAIVIIEDEASSESLFFMGRILSVEQKIVAGHYFDMSGCWDDDPWEIAYKKITCCQLNTRYGKAYARYFARQEASD